jgi:mannose-6-phosphate isomerase class I
VELYLFFPYMPPYRGEERLSLVDKLIALRRKLPSPSLGPTLKIETADSSETLVIVSTRLHGVIRFTLEMEEECSSDNIYRALEYVRGRSQKAVGNLIIT